ncbi:MAG: energy transducer TonB [Pyrinomonadaceae bacterium]
MLIWVLLIAIVSGSCKGVDSEPYNASANGNGSLRAEKTKDCDFSEFSPITVSHFVSTNLKTKVIPDYPPEALSQGVSGIVDMKILIDRNGTVTKVCVFEGSNLLTEASKDAALKWRFRRDVSEGKESFVEDGIAFKFTLDSSNRTGKVEYAK